MGLKSLAFLLPPLCSIATAQNLRGDIGGSNNSNEHDRRKLLSNVLKFEVCMQDKLTPEQCKFIIENHESSFEELKVRIQTPRTPDKLDETYFLVEVPTNIHGTMACDRNEGSTFYAKTWQKSEDGSVTLPVEDIDCRGLYAAECCDAIKNYGKTVLGPDYKGNFLQCFVHQEHLIPLINDNNDVLFHDYESNTNECDKVVMSKAEVDQADEVTRNKIRATTAIVDELISEGPNALVPCDTIRDLRVNLHNSARAIAKVQSFMHILFANQACVEEREKLSIRQSPEFVSNLEFMKEHLAIDMPSSSDTVVTIYTDHEYNIRLTPSVGGARGHNLLHEIELPEIEMTPTQEDINFDSLRALSTNIALGRFATNSHPYMYGGSPGRPMERYAANNAVDGNTEPSVANAAASESAILAGSDNCDPSWTVHFERRAFVFDIKIWGRVLPSRYEPLADFRVDLLDETGTVVKTLSFDGEVNADATVPTSMDFEGAVGKAVRIRRTDCNIPLRLAEVHVMGSPKSESDASKNLRNLSTNVAIGGTATQRPNPTSNYRHPIEPWRDGNAKYAIDGFTSGRTYTNLSLTAVNVNNFWKVNLHGRPHKIYDVAVWNREDQYGANLYDFEVNLLNAAGDVTYSYRHVPVAGVKTVFDFGGAVGTDVEIFLVSAKSPRDKVPNMLSLAEVQVFGVPVSDNGMVGENLSIGRNAVQSKSSYDISGNTLFRYMASNAVDGVKHVADSTTTKPLTTSQTNTPTVDCKPWWRVDLERSSFITLVNVYGRFQLPGQSTETALANFHVKVLDKDGNTVMGKYFQGPVNANRDTPESFNFGGVLGRSVIVERTDCGIPLALVEVDVIGLHLPPTESEVTARQQASNVAPNKPATQSTTESGMVASGAVDGGLTSGSTKTKVGLHQWWKVDLQSSFQIYDVVIWSWPDAVTREYLADYQVEVQDKNGKSIYKYLVPGSGGRSTTLDFNGIVGHQVQVSLVDYGGDTNNNAPQPRSLELMEVQVFGIAL